jgi:hypothetical protein
VSFVSMEPPWRVKLAFSLLLRQRSQLFDGLPRNTIAQGTSNVHHAQG